jgi:hypothetical protein
MPSLGLGLSTTRGTSPAPSFTPASIANLAVWLDAMDASTVLRDTGSGFVPAANGEAVARWVDKSANAHILAQTVSGRRPLLSTSAGPSSGRAIIFDGADDFLTKAANVFTMPCTVYMVLKQITWTDNDEVWDTRNSGLRPRMLQSTSSGQIRVTGGVPTTNNVQVLDTWDLVTAIITTTAQSLQINNATPGTASMAITPATPTTLNIGCNAAGIGHSNIGIAEYIVYSAGHDSATQANVKNYLKAKWGTP